MTDPQAERFALVRLLRRRGITDPGVLRAMGEIPREDFVPDELGEFAYRDTPLPIAEGQTISQPTIVAMMAEAGGVAPGDRVLEVGTGSGYAAAVFAHIADKVFTIERHATLARVAADRLNALGMDNVEVRHGDGTVGWPEAGPFDVILVAAGGPEVPPSLLEQLAPGGRLVMPVGPSDTEQSLMRIERTDGRYATTDLGAVRFVPLIGEEGWRVEGGLAEAARHSGGAVSRLVREAAEPFPGIEDWDAGSLVERIGDARVVLLGEATHGTSEFYRMRARITRHLIEHHGFRIVAIEGDWPDAARVGAWTRGGDWGDGWVPFDRFPTWMWRNRETTEFAEWLRAWNESRDPADYAGFHGLDLYSLFRSLDAVLEYLDRVDPDAARVARERYACLTPWQRDPAAYGRAVMTRAYQGCEEPVVANLRALLRRRLEYVELDGERFLDAVQNARLVADAERYYRVMYRGGAESWNLRDRHMFETLLQLLAWRGDDSRAVVWAHNSHVGDASYTRMSAEGQLNIGSLSRDHFGEEAYLIGFGTHSGSVAAASDWGGPMEFKTLRPSWAGSYEAVCHESGVDAFLLHLRDPVRPEVRDELTPARLERAVGVIYRPDTELQSHYFEAVLPDQFDSWIWFDETGPITPLPAPQPGVGVPETYPFGV